MILNITRNKRREFIIKNIIFDIFFLGYFKYILEKIIKLKNLYLMGRMIFNIKIIFNTSAKNMRFSLF